MIHRIKSLDFLIEKKIIGACFFITLAFLLISNKSAKHSDKDGYVVIVDAAHGGKDTGVINEDLDIVEKEIVLSIAKKLKKEGKSSKITYILIRKKDASMSLSNRIKMVNQLDADLLLTIHINESGDTHRAGAEAHYYDLGETSDQSKTMSELLMQNLKINDSEGTVWGTEFKILREAKCPSVLLHLGYISNASDAIYLGSTHNQTVIASQIDQAVMAFRDL